MVAIIVDRCAKGSLSRRVGSRSRRRRFVSVLSGVGLSLVAMAALPASAFAQDPAPSEDPPSEPAPSEPPAAEPAPAPPPSAEAAPPAEAAPAEPPAEAASAEGMAATEGDIALGTDGEIAGLNDIDEVVVTVDRRKKDLQDYSGVAASFSESKLSAVGITNAREMAAVVPGLQIGVQEGNTEIYIRGVGSDNNTELGDPAVALHIDGIYIPRPRGVGSMFFDIERVEVNSGPQGTLRGRNAMGGSVNIVSKRPKLSEFGANAEATFGTFAQRRYQGMVNIPLGDMVAFRAAAFSEVHDPYYQNAGPLYDLRAAEDADSYAYRLQLLYQPAEAFSVLVGYDRTYEGGTGYLGANFLGPMTANDTDGNLSDEDGPSSQLNPVAIPFDVNDIDNPRRVYYRGMYPDVNMWHEGYRGEVNFDTGPVILQASASYRRLQYNQHTGANAGAVTEGYAFDDINPDVFTNGFWDSRSQSLIAELRAFAPDDARLRWSAGGFYFNEDQQVFLGQTSDPANGFGGGEFNMPDVKGGSIAGYFDATFDVVEDFRVLGGVRYTYEDKSRKNGLWMLLQGFSTVGGVTPPGRYGTEGYRPAGLGRTQYTVPTGPDGNPDNSVENRVNLFLSGVESFGARDEVPVALCNDPLTVDGVVQPRLIDNPDGSGFRCSNGVRVDGLNNRIVNYIPQNNEVSNNFFDWRIGAEYDLAKENLLYFTVTTGHKAAGFNDTAPTADGVQLYNSGYDEESVIAFELGSKNTFFEKDVKLNASAFMYRYDNLVYQTIVGIPTGEMAMDMDGDGENDAQASPNSAVRNNTENPTPIYGLDVDLIYRLPAGLEAEVHVLLMQAKFPDGTIVRDPRISDVNPGENYLVDLGGNWLPRVSPYTINFALSQLIFTDAGSFDWVVQGQTRGTHYLSVFNGEGELLPPAPGESLPPALMNPNHPLNINSQRLTDVVPTYTRFDLGAGWKHPDGRIAINFFVNNVTNIAYSNSIIATPGLNLRFFNPPRTAGVRFRVDW